MPTFIGSSRLASKATARDRHLKSPPSRSPSVQTLRLTPEASGVERLKMSDKSDTAIAQAEAKFKK